MEWVMQPGSDVLAMEHLYASRERFVAYVRSRVDEPELAEDIVHDSLLRALRAVPDLREQERLVPWFFRILRTLSSTSTASGAWRGGTLS